MKIIYKFRIFIEEHEEVVRFIEIESISSFADFHKIIQQSVGFDSSKTFEFFMSNDIWRVEEKICSSEIDTKDPAKTILNKYINNPNQKFIYVFDPELNWVFYIELIKIQKGEISKKYPLISRKECESPKQYKLKGKEPGATAKNEYDKMAEMLIASRMLESIEKEEITEVNAEEDIEIEDEIELDESALEISEDTIDKSIQAKPKLNFDIKFEEEEITIDNDDLNFLEDDFKVTKDIDEEDEDDEESDNDFNNSGNYDDNYDDY